MDLLAQRYASPYLICDDFIRLNQFHEFTTSVLEQIAEEKIHESRWQYYLHKVFDDKMTFEDYVRICEQGEKGHGMSEEEINDVVSESRNIVAGFVPVE